MGVLGLHPSWYINVNLVICHSPHIMRQPFCLLTPMLKILSLLLCCTLLAGCGANGPALKPFKMDIQQGNVVTSKMLLQLKPGMTKSQVRFIMGTPLIVDSFHKDRWDYFYQMRQSGKIVEQRRVILDFEKELLSKVRGDVVPQGAAGAAKDADVSDLNVVNAPITVEPKPKEVSVLDRLKFWKKDEKALVKPEVTPALVTPAKAAPVEAAIVAVPLIVAAAVEDAKPEMAKPEAASASLENIEAEKNLPAKNLSDKNLSDKNLPDKTLSEKKGSKTSWVDSLKFWKKNKPTAAETAALEDAKAETAAAAANQAAQASAPIADVTAPEAQSILVVPIELPTGEVAKDAVKTRENDAEEPVKTAPLRTEPFDAKTPPAITGKESMKTLKSPSQKMLPAKPEFIKPLPAKPAVPSSVFNKAPLEKPAPVDSQLSRPLKPLPLVPKKGEQLIFRMDKTLDLMRGQAVNPQNSPDATTADVTTIDANSRPVKAESEPLPVEAAPSFFDKMLEKIGF